MDQRAANIALNEFPDDMQQQIFLYPSENFCRRSPFSPKSANEIASELEKSRKDYNSGRYKDFGVALGELRKKYGL